MTNLDDKNKRTANHIYGPMLLCFIFLSLVLLLFMLPTVFATFNVARGAPEDAIRSQISSLKGACKQYKNHIGNFPDKLQHLLNPPNGLAAKKWRGPYLDPDTILNGLITDTWGSPYQYKADENKNRVTIISPGKDKQFNTADDVPTPKD